MCHAIQGIYIICCKTSLHWAGEVDYKQRKLVKNFFAKRRITFCNNSSQLLTTWILPRFDFWKVKRVTSKFTDWFCSNVTKQGWCCPFYSALRATIWNFEMTFCFQDIFKFYGAWEDNRWWNLHEEMWPIQQQWYMLLFRLLTRLLNLVAIATLPSNDATATRTSKEQ